MSDALRDLFESVDTEFEEKDFEEAKPEEVGLGSNLVEAVFDDKSKTAVVTVIKEGWSANFSDGRQRYYTARSVADVSSLLNTSKKLYLDHSAKERSMAEWTATCYESWVVEEQGKKVAKAKVDFTDNPNTAWLYETARKYPEEVGLSIYGSGELRAGKVGDKNAAIVESITKLRSVDFVTVPAAGGKVEKVITASADSDKAFMILNESFKTIDQMIQKMSQEQQPFTDYYRVMDALSYFLSELMYTSEITTADVSTKIDEAINTFTEKVKGIILAIKKNQEDEKTETDESVKTKGIKMNLEELKKQDPEAFNLLMEQANLIAKNDAEKEAKDKLDVLVTENTQLKTDKEAVETKLQEAQKELDVYNSEKVLREKKEFIAAKLAENKLEDKVSDDFKSLLEGMDNEVAEKLIVDNAKTFATLAEGAVRGMGLTKKDEKKPEDKEIDYKKTFFK